MESMPINFGSHSLGDADGYSAASVTHRVGKPLKRSVRAFSRRIVRWLNRVAPRLVRFSASVLADELRRCDEPQRRDEVLEIAVPTSTADVRFTLIAPEHFASTQCEGVLDLWNWCQLLARRGKVYEPVMLACLTRILQRAASPQFMDIG